MKFKDKIHGDVGVITLKGKLMGLPETDELQDEVKAMMGQGIKKLVLDLDGVKSIEYVSNQDPNTFNIKTNDRDWIFVAMSGQHLVEWMSALNKTFKAIHQ